MKKIFIVVLVIIILIGIYFYFNDNQTARNIVNGVTDSEIGSQFINMILPKTRGYQNNNPTNIVLDGVQWQGEILPSQDARFKQFIDVAHGYRAAFVNLRSYIRSGLNTINKIINSWSPPSENNTYSYINDVVSQTGLNPDAVISMNNVDAIKAVISAISKHENGVPAIPSQVNDGYNLFLNS